MSVPPAKANLLDHIREGIAAFDAGMNCTYVNKEGGELLGRKPEDLIGKNYWVEFPEAKGTPFADACVRALETQETIVREDYHAPLERWFENRIHPSPDGGLTIFFTDITERRRAGEALHRSESKWRSLVETIPDYIALYDAQGRYEFLNHYAEGYSAQDVVGRHYALFLPEASRRLYDQAIERIRQTGKAEFFEHEAPGDRGVSRQYESYIVPIFEQDALTHFMVIARDITERKQAEEALRRSEERFSHAFYTSPAGMTITRIADGKFVDANDSFCRMFEFSRAEVIGHTSTELNMWTPEERKKLIDEQLRSGGLHDFELRARAKSGRVVNILFSSKPMELGGETHHITTMIDITERKRAEEALKESEKKYSLLFDKSAVATVLFKMPEVVIADVNAAVEELVGYTREEMLGKTTLELGIVRGVNPIEVKAKFEKEGSLIRNEMRIFTKSGEERIIVSKTFPLEFGRQRYALSTMQDITERKRAEEKLRESEALFSKVFQSSPIGINIFRVTDNRSFAVNDAFLKIIGYSREEVMEHTAAELDLFVNLEARNAWMKQLRSGGGVNSQDAKIRSKSGEIKDTLASLNMIEVNGEPMVLVIATDITERKQAEEQIRYQARLLGEVNDAIIGTDVNRVITVWNRAAERLYGWSAEEAIGKPSGELIRSEFSEAQVSAALRELAEKGRFRAEVLTHHRDGSPIWVDGSSILLREEDGTISGFLGVNRDITERKRAEAALRASEERLRLSTELADVAVWEYSFVTNRMSRSKNHDKLYGLPWQEEWEFETFLNATHPDDRAFSNEIIQRSAAPGGPDQYAFDFRVVYPDQTIHWLNVVGQVVERNSEGRGTMVRGTLIDVTDRKRAEEQLQEIHNRLANIIATTPGIVCSFRLKPDGSVCFPFGGERLAEAYGVWQGRLAEDAAPFFALVQPDDLEDLRASIADSARRLSVWRHEWRVRHPVRGEVWIEGHSVPLREPDGSTVWHGIAADITERKRAEQELRLSRDRLAELSRRLVEAHETEHRAIGRELHDQIGQMLTALKLTIEVAMQLPPEQALQKAAQGRELLDDLLTRVSALSLELRPPMLDDLGLIPALLWHINRYQEQTGIAVDFKHSGVEGRRFAPEIETTAYRIVQESLTNVARHAHATRARLEVHARGGEMEIRIEDNGAGFEPQVALAKQRGLSAMRERAQLIGGEFHIESETGRGTHNRIRLPLQETAP